ncbi:glycosyltransferase family 4 protein [Candidatus Dojkabacteria bacterium]|nr:glycosyltransferase family 4 protein [Candidatus Dojkabacteria bacterium]
MKTQKKKIGIVIHRYGPADEITGGAEYLTREIAEHLKDNVEIEIITTCAKDYLTWKNEYSPGEETINGVKVRRFKVDFERNLELFLEIEEQLKNDRSNIELAITWEKNQGPYSSQLFEYLKENHTAYDRLIFITYLYATTVFGINIAPEKSILIPTAHDEPPIYYRIFRQVFIKPYTIAFLAPEERDLVHRIFSNRHIRHSLIGAGVEINQKLDYKKVVKKFNLKRPYIVFAGRICNEKGCGELFEYFHEYKKKYKSDLELALMGNALIDIPKDKSIKYLGFVSEEEKFNVMSGSLALINNSPFESLSLIILESFLCKRPVLANAKSLVMKGHCERSGGGYAFDGQNEFFRYLQKLETNQSLSNIMGENGYRYVKRNYSWDVMKGRFLALIKG